MTIVGALAGGGPPASVRDRKLYVLVDIFNNGLLNGIRILFFLCCKFCLSVTDLLGRSSQVLPDVTEKRSKFFGQVRFCCVQKYVTVRSLVTEVTKG